MNFNLALYTLCLNEPKQFPVKHRRTIKDKQVALIVGEAGVSTPFFYFSEKLVWLFR